MFRDQKVVVVMPAYNADQTLRTTYDEVMEQNIVDLVIVVDDGSQDATVNIARTLPNTIVHVHSHNQGYGANQKTCYRLALEQGGDIIVMVHPDYQYSPQLIPAMVSMIASGLYPCVLGSRVLGGYALKGGMPVWKYIANRGLTLVENILFGAKLSEYHTGYRTFSRQLLEQLPINVNSDDFVFDNQMLAHVIKQHPDRLIGFGFLRLGADEPSLIDQFIEWGFKGIKITIPLNDYHDKANYAYYKKAQAYQLPMLFHTGILNLPKPQPQADIRAA